MIVRSNVITGHDIGRASNAAGTHFQDTFSGQDRGWYIPIREFKPRRFAYGYEFFLSGSSPYAAAHDRDEKAATWDEWGNVIAALYRIDPEASIGFYKNLAHFLEFTERAATSWYAERRGYEAPWLQDAELHRLAS